MHEPLDNGGDQVRKNEWLFTAPLSLGGQVELTRGNGTRPLLYHRERGTYTNLTEAGAQLLTWLDGSRTGVQIVAELKRQGLVPKPLSEAAVAKFLSDLRAAGVLNIPPDRPARVSRLISAVRYRPMLRLSFTRSLNGALDPVAAILRQVPARVLRPCLGVLASAAVGLTVLALVRGEMPSQVAWGPVTVAMVIQLVCHELAHALACRYVGVPVREAGIGLLYGILPVAYVDYTDVYRASRRMSEAAIALAGPVHDALWTGVTAWLCLRGGPAASSVYPLLVLQAIYLVNHFNLLLPTDGYQALEAFFGKNGFRQKAFDQLLQLVAGSHAAGTAATPPHRLAIPSIIYAILSLAVVTSLLAGILITLTSLLRGS